MSAKVRWWKDCWWVSIHHEGKRRMRKLGPTKADQRRAEKIAEQVNAALALHLYRPGETGPKPIPFEAYAKDWLRREVTNPAERHVEGALRLRRLSSTSAMSTAT